MPRRWRPGSTAGSVVPSAMAVIARSTPPAAVAEPWWRRHFGLGWLVPLTAGAVAVALYVAGPRPVQTPDSYAPVLQSTRAQDERGQVPPAVNEAREENRAQPSPSPQPERLP